MTTKTEAASQVRSVLQAVKDRLAQPGGAKLNEATTRAHFLNPLLNALGYSGIDDLEFEHYLPDGKTFLDYRLHVDGKARVAVEAKSLDVPITDKEAAQGVSYATVLGDEWTVLTNARQWRLYHTFAQAPLAGKLVLSVDLTAWQTDAEFDRVFEQLWLVSKESFLAGEGPTSWLTGKKVDQHLRHAMVDPSSAEVRYIRRQLETKGVVVSVDDIAGWFKRQLAEATHVPPPLVYPPAGASVGTRVADAGATYTSTREPPTGTTPTYWIVPSGRQGGHSAEEHLRAWLDRGFWGFGPTTPGRKAMQPGDWACFYAAATHAVLAVGRVNGSLDQLVTESEWPGPGHYNPLVYKVPLSNIRWLDPAPILDEALRSGLDAFHGKAPGSGWSWLVQTTHRVSKSDFAKLTGDSEPE